MEKIAAIVEGHTEAHFIQATYPCVQVLRAIPNGRDVAVHVIVESIIESLELLSGQICRVIVLLDREGRETSAPDMLTAIRAGLAGKCGDRSIYIGLSDRHIENWILADDGRMQDEFALPEFTYGGDGTFGKSTLRALCRGISMAPRDLARLLKKCSATKASYNSPSLNRLLSEVDFDWQWAKS